MHGRLASMANDSLGSTVATTSLMEVAGVADKSMATIQVQGHQFVLTSTVKRLLP